MELWSRDWGSYPQTKADVAKSGFYEQWDVLEAVAKRRELEVEHIQPEEQIGPEAKFIHGRPEIVAGRGNDPRMHAERLRTSDPFELPIFEDPEKLRLQLRL